MTENKYKQMWEELEKKLSTKGKTIEVEKTNSEYLNGVRYGYMFAKNYMEEVKKKHFPPMLKSKLTLKFQSRSEIDMDYVRETIRILEEYLRDREMSFDIEWQSDEELRGDPFFY
jgi:hypothetical protein